MNPRFFRPLLPIVLGTLALACSAFADTKPEIYLEEHFDKPLSNQWEKEGLISIVNDQKFDGTGSLRISLTKENFATTTLVRSPEVPVRAGYAEFSGVFKSALESPDTSFNATISLQYLDASGAVISTFRIAEIMGDKNWTPLKQQIEIPAATVKARFQVKLNKAIGHFWVDNVSFRPVDAQTVDARKISRILLTTSRMGNMFYPGETVSFHVIVESRNPLPEKANLLTANVHDYWGVENGAPVKVKLSPMERTGEAFRLQGTIDLARYQFETGKYYELQVAMDPGTNELEREYSTFVFFPEAISKKYTWQEVPFSTRNWDNRVPAYFQLSDRLGVRLVGVWGLWSAKPPYEPVAPCYDQIEKLNLTMLARTPIVLIEKHKKGYEDYNETALRDGVTGFLAKFGKEKPMVITLGNEPQTTGPTVEVNLRAYKIVYEQIKKLSPGTFVVGTSVGPAEEYFKQGFQKYSDAVDFHTYRDSEVLKETFKQYEELFAKYGGKQPIWSTELGLNSQGLSRRVVAGDLIRKFSWFFCYGGSNASWFGICYPDREGKLRGAADDSHNVFNGIYGNFSPRLDAIAYYNMVNGICIKKFVAHQVYNENLHSFLFVDKDGENLQVLWKDRGSADLFVPIPKVSEVKLTRIDGTVVPLATANQGVTLRIDEDPLLLTYKGSQTTLPATLKEGRVAVTSIPGRIIRGETVQIGIQLNGTSKEKLKVDLPKTWKAGGFSSKGETLQYSITAPSDTEARFVPIRIRLKDSKSGDGDLTMIVPVSGQLSAKALPSVTTDGSPAIELLVRNNSPKAASFEWKLSFDREIRIESGRYNLEHTHPSSAYFTKAAEGRQDIAAETESSIKVPLAGLDPLSAYKIQATVTDQAQRHLTCERYVGGFVSVPKASKPPTLDGKLDEADWARCKPQILDQARQLAQLIKSGAWNGPTDLSGELRFLWDAKNLYLGFRVKDDLFKNDKEGSAIWNGDGLQLLIDPARSSKEKPGKYDYAIAQGKSGPVAWCYLSADGRAPAGEAKDIVLAMKLVKDGSGDAVYEVAIPWTRLAPFQPGVGANLGMAVILNEDDAPKRDSFMTWFGDIQSKEVDAVGDLILTD